VTRPDASRPAPPVAVVAPPDAATHVAPRPADAGAPVIDAAVADAANRPDPTRPLSGVGLLREPASAPPYFERVSCGSARPGDRVVTAAWSTRGYGGGRCEGAGCGPALARALQHGRAVGESTRVRLTLDRENVVGEKPERVEARCRVLAGGGAR